MEDRSEAVFTGFEVAEVDGVDFLEGSCASGVEVEVGEGTDFDLAVVDGDFGEFGIHFREVVGPDDGVLNVDAGVFGDVGGVEMVGGADVCDFVGFGAAGFDALGFDVVEVGIEVEAWEGLFGTFGNDLPDDVAACGDFKVVTAAFIEE